STHSRVSSGSMSGSWLGRPSLMIEKRWLPEATGGPRLPTVAGWTPAPESSCRGAFSPLAAFAVVHLNLHTRRRLVHLYRWVTWWSGRWPGTARGPGAPLQTAFRGPNCDRDFKLWANCDWRTAATQCGLSHQEVPMPQTPRLTPATARGRARAAGGGLRERNQGGR